MKTEILTLLLPNPKNPRTISKEKFEKLKKSLKEFPEMLDKRPIVYDENMIVLGGNMRLRAMIELSKEGVVFSDKALVQVKGWTEDQKREFIIKDNVPFGEWDDDALANEWSDLPLDEWGLDTSAWETEKEIEEDEAPEVSQEPAISKVGEVYQLGRHYLMCGDSTKIEDVEKLMGGMKADMVLTDPPYNFSIEGAGYLAKKRENINKRIQNITNFNPQDISYLSEMKIAKSHYFFMNKTLLKDYLNIFNSKKFNLLVWEKSDSPPMINNNFAPNIEYIAYFYEDGRVWNNGLDIENYRKVYRSSMNEGRKEGNDEHPTIKPVKLLTRFINISSSENGNVLDLFLGSGSTLIACEQTNRICYGMEISESYCDVIRKRYAKFIGKEAEWQQITPQTQSR